MIAGNLGWYSNILKKLTMKLYKLIQGALFGMMALTMVSCQSTGGTQDAGSAVICDKCKTVWVNRPSNIGAAGKGGGGVTTYRDARVMKCPDCENAMATFVKTGQLKHRCTRCGGTMTHCTSH